MGIELKLEKIIPICQIKENTIEIHSSITRETRFSIDSNCRSVVYKIKQTSWNLTKFKTRFWYNRDL